MLHYTTLYNISQPNFVKNAFNRGKSIHDVEQVMPRYKTKIEEAYFMFKSHMSLIPSFDTPVFILVLAF